MTLEEIWKLVEDEKLAGKELDAAFAANNRNSNLDTYTKYLEARQKWNEARKALLFARLDEEVSE
jgi:hypothetical protein